VDFQTWATFTTIWAVALIGVGANSLVCMTAGATSGFSRGMWSAFGVTTASLVHSMIAAFGFSTIMLAYSGAYSLLKWLAVGYLIYLGVRQWRKEPTSISDGNIRQESRLVLYRRGLLVSLTNPQSFLYYLVFYTPFLDPNQPLFPQIVILIPTAVLLVFVGYTIYVLVGSPIRYFLTSKRRQVLLNRVSGTSFILFGLVLATTSAKR